MFAYCLNNPVIYLDESGERVIAVGFQVDLQAGDTCIGVEIIIFFDPEVCNGEDMAVVVYSYSGVSLSMNEIMLLTSMLEKETTMLIAELGTADQDALLFTMKAALEGYNLSGGVFLIEEFGNFHSYDDYSGAFDTYSATVEVNGIDCTAFWSTCETCSAYGIKFGAGVDKKKWLLPFDFSYSRTYYSDPIVLWEGGF